MEPWRAAVDLVDLQRITDEVKRIVEAQMQLDDETTAVQLRALLAQKGAYYLD